jgi:hypothetical protein
METTARATASITVQTEDISQAVGWQAKSSQPKNCSSEEISSIAKNLVEEVKQFAL